MQGNLDKQIITLQSVYKYTAQAVVTSDSIYISTLLSIATTTLVDCKL